MVRKLTDGREPDFPLPDLFVSNPTEIQSNYAETCERFHARVIEGNSLSLDKWGGLESSPIKRSQTSGSKGV